MAQPCGCFATTSVHRRPKSARESVISLFRGFLCTEPPGGYPRWAVVSSSLPSPSAFEARTPERTHLGQGAGGRRFQSYSQLQPSRTHLARGDAAARVLGWLNYRHGTRRSPSPVALRRRADRSWQARRDSYCGPPFWLLGDLRQRPPDLLAPMARRSDGACVDRRPKRRPGACDYCFAGGRAGARRTRQVACGDRHPLGRSSHRRRRARIVAARLRGCRAGLRAGELPIAFPARRT